MKEKEKRKAKRRYNAEAQSSQRKRRGTQDPGKKPNLGHPAKSEKRKTYTESAEFTAKRKQKE